MIDLSTDEREVIEAYIKLKHTFIVMIIFLGGLAFCFSFFIFRKFIPVYLAPLENLGNIQEFVKAGLVGLGKIGLFWIFLSICIVLGNFISYLKISKVLKKML